jgi:hypothetical protein
MLLNQTGVGRKANHGSVHFTNHPSHRDAARELERFGGMVPDILDSGRPTQINEAQELRYPSSSRF